MASISRDKNGRKRILFIAEDGSRKTIRLGKTTLRDAERLKRRIESILSGRQLGQVDPETANWISGIPDDLHNRLAAVGLVSKRVNTALGPLS